jgi:hypothetical protein
MLYLSALLFLISIGSMNLQRTKNPDAMIESSTNGSLFMSLGSILPFVMLFFTMSAIWELKWFWNILISTILTFMLSTFLAGFYCSILGYRSKPQFSLIVGGYVRHNIHIVDAIITFAVGVVIFILVK